jgi:HlyD family secretion protein
VSYQYPVPFVAERELSLFDDPQADVGRTVRFGMAAVGVLAAGLVAAAAFVPITGAVMGYGEVSVASKVKKIAHPTGGVIAQVFVHDGDRVKRGQPLMRLDTTVAGVSASTSAQTYDQLLAARARLTAERDGLSSIVYPAELTASTAADVQAAMVEETRLFRLRQQARAGQQAQFVERVRQANEQIAGLQAQVAASHRQSALIEPEREGVRALYAKNLVTVARMNQLERTAVELDGGAASLRAQIAQIRAHIAELRQASIQLSQDARSQAATELADVITKLGDQQVRHVSASDTFDRSLLRAPSDGVVSDLGYSTIGGVVPAAQTIVSIVPDADRMVIEAKVSPADIDQLHIGQHATLRFTAFNQQTTPQLDGTLRRVAAERTTDERTGSAFYKVELAIAPGQLQRLGSLKLVPGMPVDAFVQTGDRSLLSYITKPLRDQLSRAFREN